MQIFISVMGKYLAILLIIWTIYLISYGITALAIGTKDFEKVIDKNKALGYLFFIAFILSNLWSAILIIYLVGSTFIGAIKILWGIK